MNQYKIIKAAKSYAIKKLQTLSIRQRLNRLPVYPNLSVLEKLPIEVYTASLYNSFATTQIRQDHIKPLISSMIHSTYIWNIYKNPFISKVKHKPGKTGSSTYSD